MNFNWSALYSKDVSASVEFYLKTRLALNPNRPMNLGSDAKAISKILTAIEFAFSTLAKIAKIHRGV